MMAQRKKLYRSRDNRIIAGICGGLGDYFDTDPVLIRGFFLLLALINGVGILLYLIFLCIIPSQPLKLRQADEEADIKEIAKDVKEKTEAIASEIREDPRIKKLRGKKWWPSTRRGAIGALIVVGGILFVVDRFVSIKLLSWALLWRAGIILIGLYLIFTSGQAHQKEDK